MHVPNFKVELSRIRSYEFVAGCDEAGMGPLAGSVVAAICILDKNDFGEGKKSGRWFARVRDSKMIGVTERLQLERLIKENCLAFGIGESSVAEIDRLNIHHARQRAMLRAWKNLLKKFPRYSKQNGVILIDGTFIVAEIDRHQETFVKGDADILSIAAASILAKNYRDRKMIALHKKHPEYGFDQHKGYGTAKHIAALKKNGVTMFHRKGFLKNIIAER